ncbi:hypothetical protein DSAG12_02040 [Promethearchaeum syntrophicum]|uniref:DUF4129 domain-containing protein n=1 Tax=Promethearchaeum syntrophicum TaxID=2594042 RepID=A0A5B9DBS9_9ARCH|nr:hypothetical protein [Candidatus Prometheoarchaeum syntrophicum]QEE16210.1 hypothetical protein DSAG12_02040 [Candidatus Prometheoarchaeum syntrophicum]
MSAKSDLKLSNKRLSIIVIFVICISVISIAGIFPNLIPNDTKNPFDNESNLTTPQSAAYNTLLFITGVDQTHTVRGSNFNLNGYVQKFDGSWTNTSGIPVYPILDGHLCDGSDSNTSLYPNLTVLSSEINSMQGQFSISIIVRSDYDYSLDLEVLANITEIAAQNIYVDEHTVQNTTLYHDITTPTQIILDTGTDLNPVIPGDQFTLSMTFQDSTGTDLTSPSTNFNVLTNGAVNGGYVISTSGGSGDVLITTQSGYTSVGVEFLGMIPTTVGLETYYEFESSSQSTPIVRVESINGDVNITNSNDTSRAYVYTNGSFLVKGNIWANGNSSFKLSNRNIEILFNGQSLLTTTTGADGLINEIVNLEEIGFYESDINFTITIKLLGYDDTLYTNPSSFRVILSSLVQDAPLPLSQALQKWGLIVLPILAIAGIVVGIVIFQRKRMEAAQKLDQRFRAVDKTAKFAIITMLYSQGRRREAIAYTYKIYTDLINEKYSLQRTSAQTLREFAIVCVMKYGLDPLRVYPYISMIEDVIYGAYDVDRKIFEKSITLFGRIFQEITGILLTYDLSISEHSNLEQMTLKVSVPDVKTKKIGE